MHKEEQECVDSLLARIKELEKELADLRWEVSLNRTTLEGDMYDFY